MSNQKRAGLDLREVWNKARNQGGAAVDAAYQAIASAYAKLGINNADPHAFNRMLTHLKVGVEKPVDYDQHGKDRGVISWVQERQQIEGRAA